MLIFAYFSTCFRFSIDFQFLNPFHPRPRLMRRILLTRLGCKNELHEHITATFLAEKQIKSGVK
jgi:hypothetical protein